MLAPLAPSTVRVAALLGLSDLVGAKGTDFDALLRRQGVDPSLMQEPDNRLTFGQFVGLLDAAAAATGDDCIGLHMGAAQSIHIAGVLGYALRAATNVRIQLTQTQRFIALHQDCSAMDLRVVGDVATLTYAVYDPKITSHRHDVEATLAFCVSQWRLLIGASQWAPASVHFEHPAPASERELRRFFACPVYFSEPFDGLRFPASFLDTPIRTADVGLYQVLAQYAEECLARHTHSPTLTGRVRQLIVAGLSNGGASIENVARRMAMTPRTMQRRLGDEGWKYSALVDDTRRELATKYLRDPRISLSEAAFLVGYSDLTAFHRAFRRWFKQTPLDYQRQTQEQTLSS